THGPSGCQGVPNRPEFREAATTLRAQCETLDQPAALAAYLNPLLKEAGLTKFCTGRADGRGLEDPRAQRTTVLEITPRTSLYLTHFSPVLDERPVEKVEILGEFNSRKKPLFWFDFPL